MQGLIIFLSVYFCIYGGTHIYAFMTLKKGFVFNSWMSMGLAVFMALMVLAPIGIRIAERYGHQYFARILAYIGFIWMGFIFVFFSVSAVFDIYRVLLFLARFIFQKYFLPITPMPAFSCTVALICAGLVMGYGLFEAANIRLEHIRIYTDKLPKNMDRFRIAQISDIHLGMLVGDKRLYQIIKQIEQAEPHLLVSTGDLVDGEMSDPDILARMLRKIEIPYGKFAVTGNHELYAGLSHSIAFTEEAGFKILRGESTTLPALMHIVGVDDPAIRSKRVDRVSEKDLLSKLDPNLFTVLLKHQPVVDPKAVDLFDLQLSGHTHQGQIFPFTLMTKLAYRIDSGLTPIGENTHIYVSRGTGTWGPPIRFLAPPEVTLLEIIRKIAE